MLVACRPQLCSAAFTPVLSRRLKSNMPSKHKLDKNSTDSETKHRNGSHISKDVGNELVGNNPEERNWKGMCIAVLVIIMVCGCVVLAIVLLSNDRERASMEKVSLSDILDETWKEGVVRKTQWVAGSLIWQDHFGNVLRMISPDIDATTLIANTTVKTLRIKNFVISGDFRYALLKYNSMQGTSFSHSASYVIYDIQNKKWQPLLHKGTGKVFQYASFGPRGNQLLYIVNGDIYYQESVVSPAINLTEDGYSHLVLNGLSNWQYEEMIFKSSVAHWFSPNGRYLAYARFDDHNVAEAYISSYSETLGSEERPYVYPHMERYKYSKAGYPITNVNVHVVDLVFRRTVRLNKPLLLRKPLEVLHSLSWSRDSKSLLITWSNRSQTESVTQQCSPDESSCRDGVLPPKSDDSTNTGWIPHLNQRYIFSNKKGVFFCIISRSQGSQSSFMHIAMINYTSHPPAFRFLTDGLWEVNKLLHYSPSSRSIYYLSNEQHPNTRHLYQVYVETLRRVCLSCSEYSYISDILKQTRVTAGNEHTKPCLYYDVEFGTSSNWFLLHCLGPGIPYSAVGTIRFDQYNQTTNSKIFSFSSKRANPKIKTSFLYNYLPTSLDYSNSEEYRYGSVTVKDRVINFKMIQPGGDQMTYIPLVFQIGDIGSQGADFRFHLDFAEYFVSHNNVAFVFVDGAGSGNRGSDILHSVFGQPGVIEIKDINAVMEYIDKNWKIKSSKVGIIGKGYGGYVSALALTEAQNSIQCGVAISPIVNWALHSSFESERIVGNPLSDALNYEKSNLLKRVGMLKERNLLVFQGMLDKVVNQQQAILLQHFAVNKNLPLKTLQTIFYPDQNHKLANKKSKKAMYKTARVFLQNCLDWKRQT